jgi:hypothetical protein
LITSPFKSIDRIFGRQGIGNLNESVVTLVRVFDSLGVGFRRGKILASELAENALLLPESGTESKRGIPLGGIGFLIPIARDCRE